MNEIIIESQVTYGVTAQRFALNEEEVHVRLTNVTRAAKLTSHRHRTRPDVWHADDCRAIRFVPPQERQETLLARELPLRAAERDGAAETARSALGVAVTLEMDRRLIDVLFQLFSNQLSTLPAELGLLTNLTSLGVRACSCPRARSST
jgi:hypothetical protein